MQQRQQQAQLDAAYQQFVAQRDYARQQAEWLNNQIRGIAPITPTTTMQSSQSTGGTYSASPLAQLAGAAAGARALGSLVG
jgi:hypothetical protein